jgi:hypothetical protein
MVIKMLLNKFFYKHYAPAITALKQNDRGIITNTFPH